MPTGDIYLSNTADSGCITTSNAGDYPYFSDYGTYGTGNIYQEPAVIRPYIYPTPYMGLYEPNNNKKGGDDMRYLYEVILVNPKNDACYSGKTVKKTETSALMKIYQESQFHNDVDFDDLKTSCRVLMEWKKEKSLKKAIETIKEAVE